MWRYHAIFLRLAAVCVTGCVAVCCDDDEGGGGGGVSKCQQACDKAAACDLLELDDVDQCVDDCRDAKPLVRKEVFDAIADCAEQTDCSELSYEYCLQKGLEMSPEGVAEEHVKRVCAQLGARCGGSAAEVECLKQTNGIESIAFLNMMTDDTLQCLSDCIGEASCFDLMMRHTETAESCSARCGVPLSDEAFSEMAQ